MLASRHSRFQFHYADYEFWMNLLERNREDTFIYSLPPLPSGFPLVRVD
jgi:hypothetical protein